jgi:hypothetical protein
LRLRRALAEDGGAGSSPMPAARMFRVNLESCTYYWGFMVLVSVLFWILIYEI